MWQSATIATVGHHDNMTLELTDTVGHSMNLLFTVANMNPFRQ